jgi:hypothetical protein
MRHADCDGLTRTSCETFDICKAREPGINKNLARSGDWKSISLISTTASLRRLLTGTATYSAQGVGAASMLRAQEFSHAILFICNGAIARKSQRDGSARPIRLMRLVHRIFWFRQSRIGIDPRDSILLGNEFPEMVHGPIRPHYLHAPNLTLLHWR